MYEIFRGLGLKFDTTALALALSMALMFIHFLVERLETSLLDQVNWKVEDELWSRFTAAPTVADGSLVAARRATESMVHSSEIVQKRQIELWQAAVEAAGREWTKMSETASGHVQTALSSATAELARRADMLQRAVEATTEVAKLENALNRNLNALAGSKHFEQTVVSLAAAVHLLNARLAETENVPAPIKLEPTRRTTNAA